MTIQLRAGTVVDTADITNTGLFQAMFDVIGKSEPVKYVSPYGTPTASFMAIPAVGSEILALYEDDASKATGLGGNYYIGSVISGQPGRNFGVPTVDDLEVTHPEVELIPSTPSNQPATRLPYTPSDKLGLNSPMKLPATPIAFPKLKDDFFSQKSWAALPMAFRGMYEAKGVVPQQLGMTTEGGDSLIFSNRNNSTEESDLPFQDYRVALRSGKGKKLELTDSPIVNGLTYSNEHTGLDYLIWCSKANVNSPFSEGEFHMRTHGPVNLYTLWSRFHIWIEDGYNIDLENKSSDSKAFLTTGPKGTPRHSDRRRDSEGKLMSGLPDPGTGPYSSRKGVFGNQTTGCINLLSHNNNITLRAMNPDSVIYINAPGERCKVIIETGGSVDINADKKITIQSQTEVEINAPLVDINGKASGISTDSKVDIHAGRINLNDPDHSWDGY
mgnify:FL=1